MSAPRSNRSAAKKIARSSSALGAFLRKARQDVSMSLREVEEATRHEVSNAYLSQLENGKIDQPSPRVLYSLAQALNADYEALMTRAGYLLPSSATVRHTSGTGSHSIGNLTADEESQLLEYLTFLRRKRK